MSHGPEEINYDKKGGCMAWGFVYLALFIILLIWVYNQNFVGIPA